MSLQFEPELDRLRVEVEARFQGRDLIRVESQKPALHLNVKTAGVGRRAVRAARIDDGDLAILLSEEPGNTQPQESTAHHHYFDVARECAVQDGRLH
jgi:hypothetical protein